MWANALGNTENGDTGCLQSISNSQHGRRLAGPHDPFDDHDSGRDVTKKPAHAEPDDGRSHALLLAKLLPLLPIASFRGGQQCSRFRSEADIQRGALTNRIYEYAP